MRHEYVADIGDFGKYALLNALAEGDLRLGVVWYLNVAPESNRDGLFTAYGHLRSCNPVLHDKLLNIVQNNRRSLEEVEGSTVLPPKTLFYREPMPYPAKPCFGEIARGHETSRRRIWHEEAFSTLSKAELVFLDPDNGLAGPRIKPYSPKSPKYAFRDEVSGWLERGKSVVLYQHQQRKPLQQQALEQLEMLSGLGHPGWAVTFHRIAVRIYFILPATDDHRARLRERTKAFLSTEWGQKYHFRPAAGWTA